MRDKLEDKARLFHKMNTAAVGAVYFAFAAVIAYWFVFLKV